MASTGIKEEIIPTQGHDAFQLVQEQLQSSSHVKVLNQLNTNMLHLSAAKKTSKQSKGIKATVNDKEPTVKTQQPKLKILRENG